jgi:RND family efflux transporter MFP subunit
MSLVISCSTNKDESETVKTNIPVVSVTKVNEVNYSEEIRATGRISFNNEYKMSFKTAGIVENIYVKEGQRVNTGKVLATINTVEIEAKTSQAEIVVTKAKRDYERTKTLYKGSVATLEQLENVESQLQNAQKNLQAAQFNLDQTKMIAPANGIIQKIMVRENEITGAGNPIVVFGAEDKGKVLVTSISDVDAVKIKNDDKATLHFDAFPDSIFNGEIIEIAGMANAKTGTFEIKIKVYDSKNKLKSGFIGSAKITSSITNHWIEIPIESLIQADKKNGVVYKVENEMAVKQKVHVAKILNDKLLISKGLSTTDNIIKEGFSKLKGDSIPVKSNY